MNINSKEVFVYSYTNVNRNPLIGGRSSLVLAVWFERSSDAHWNVMSNIIWTLEPLKGMTHEWI